MYAHEVCTYVCTYMCMCAYAPRPFCLYSQSHCALAHGLGRSEPAQTGAAMHSNTVWYTYVHTYVCTHANQPLYNVWLGVLAFTGCANRGPTTSHCYVDTPRARVDYQPKGAEQKSHCLWSLVSSGVTSRTSTACTSHSPPLSVSVSLSTGLSHRSTGGVPAPST